MGFSAILAEEYILIRYIAYHLQFGLTNHKYQKQQKVTVEL